jgi:hypothetical protein
MIATTEIQLSQVCGVFQPLDQIISMGERVFTFLRDLIQTPIVNTHPQCAISLLDEQDR